MKTIKVNFMKNKFNNEKKFLNKYFREFQEKLILETDNNLKKILEIKNLILETKKKKKKSFNFWKWRKRFCIKPF